MDIFSRSKLLVLPRDLAEFGIDPREFEVAKAVRMSMSIPLFYHPYKLVDSKGAEHWIVDGGLLCNHPMHLFDDGDTKIKRPLFGFKLCSCGCTPTYLEDAINENQKKEKLAEYVVRIADLILMSQDIKYTKLVDGDAERTVVISVEVNGKVVSPIDFGLSQETSTALARNGYSTAKKFLETWDFKKWQKKFR